MTTTQVNYVNIGLMFASVAVAFAVPFELFLLAYAVLGPLHYLTELSWLHDRKNFTNRRGDGWLLAGIAAAVLLTTDWFPALTVTSMVPWNAELALAALGLALVFVLTRSPRVRLLSIPVVVLVTLAAHHLKPLPIPAEDTEPAVTVFDLWCKIYLTTIIHVFVFTGAFILWGALKGNSRSGMVSFWVFAACALGCLLVPAMQALANPSDYTIEAYIDSAGPLLWSLVDNLPFYDPIAPDQLFQAPAAIQVGRFIAFAYTYHYLNWFSKTSIIKWHEVPKTRAIAILGIWIFSLALYAQDFVQGLRWLFLLSLLHVFLEFPLNWRSFIGIGQELTGRVRGRLSTS